MAEGRGPFFSFPSHTDISDSCDHKAIMPTNPGPTYPAARAVAQRLEERIAATGIDFDRPFGIAPRPDAVVIEEVIRRRVLGQALLREEVEGGQPSRSRLFLRNESICR